MIALKISIAYDCIVCLKCYFASIQNEIADNHQTQVDFFILHSFFGGEGGFSRNILSTIWKSVRNYVKAKDECQLRIALSSLPNLKLSRTKSSPFLLEISSKFINE